MGASRRLRETLWGLSAYDLLESSAAGNVLFFSVTVLEKKKPSPASSSRSPGRPPQDLDRSLFLPCNWPTAAQLSL